MTKPKVWGKNLDWTVQTYGTQIMTEPPQTDESHFALMRSDCKHLLGYVSDHYETIQNQMLFDLLQPLVDEQLAEISYTGYMRYGKTVIVQAKLNTGFDIDGMEHKNFVTISNTHAGKGNLEIGVGNIRLCCNNQYHANRKALTNKSTFSHRIGVNDELHLDSVMAFVAAEQQVYQNSIEELKTLKLKQTDLREIIENVYGVNKNDKIYNNIVRLYRHGAGNTGSSAYDLFSATTDYNTNLSKSSKEYSIANALIGSGADKSHQMLESLLALC
jgi:hypothetical protein